MQILKEALDNFWKVRTNESAIVVVKIFRTIDFQALLLKIEDRFDGDKKQVSKLFGIHPEVYQGWWKELDFMSLSEERKVAEYALEYNIEIPLKELKDYHE